MPRCANGEAAYMGSALVAPACPRSRATVRLTVIYGRPLPFSGRPDADALALCHECAKLIKADAQRHGYAVQWAAA